MRWWLLLFLGASACATAVPGGSFSATGHLVTPGDPIPATVIYDEQRRFLRVDIAEPPSIVLVDWTRTPASARVVSKTNCRGSELKAPMPGEAPAASIADAIAPPGDAVRFVREKDMPLQIAIESAPVAFVVALDRLSPLGAAEPMQGIPAQCDDGGFDALRPPEEDPAAAAAADESWIQTNTTWKGGKITHVQPEFRSTKSQYETQVAKCRQDKDCNIQYLHNTYGWHCGPGWGKGQSYWLDPLDAVCRDHDRQVWGKTDWQGWCGMYAALFCWKQSHWFAWTNDFGKSRVAYDIIYPIVNGLALIHDCVWPKGPSCQ